MKKEYYIYCGCALLVLFATVFAITSGKSSASDTDRIIADGGMKEYLEEKKDSYEDDNDSKIAFISPKIVTDPESMYVLVNKEYTVNKNYVPDDLVKLDVEYSFDYEDEKRYLRKEAAQAMEKLFDEADDNGHELLATSGYRSYGRQTTLYNYNLLNKGYDYTNVYSAMPGTSEHQTGWSMDITCASLDKKLSPDFGNTDEGKWVNKNCYKYGFIIRYPKGKEKITGYGYEPWHLRYVGKELAKFLYDNNMTLDEYYGYSPDTLYIEREQMAYYDNLITMNKSQKNDVANNVSSAELDDIVDGMGVTQEEVGVIPSPSYSIKPVETKTPMITKEPTKEPAKNETYKPVVTKEPTKQPTSTPADTSKPSETKIPDAMDNTKSPSTVTPIPNTSTEEPDDGAVG